MDPNIGPSSYELPDVLAEEEDDDWQTISKSKKKTDVDTVQYVPNSKKEWPMSVFGTGGRERRYVYCVVRDIVFSILLRHQCWRDMVVSREHNVVETMLAGYLVVVGR